MVSLSIIIHKLDTFYRPGGITMAHNDGTRDLIPVLPEINGKDIFQDDGDLWGCFSGEPDEVIQNALSFVEDNKHLIKAEWDYKGKISNLFKNN